MLRAEVLGKRGEYWFSRVDTAGVEPGVRFFVFSG